MPPRPAPSQGALTAVAAVLAALLAAALPIERAAGQDQDPGESRPEPAAPAFSSPVAASVDLLDRPAILAPAAVQSLLLDIARAGERLVAVGERGHVLLSDDAGRSWRQAEAVPGRTMLTAVAFADSRLGWAVGHDETILHTADGGETWARQHYAPESQQPLLDVWFADARRGIAIGAYESCYVTEDGGVNWTRAAFEPTPPPGARPPGPDDDIPPDYHLNRIAGLGERLYIAAEAGQLYRSDDGGRRWQTLPSPYAGSFFGLLPLSADAILAFGLRGNLFRSDDGGGNWRKLESGTTAMLTDGFALPDGRLVLVGLSGAVLVSGDGGNRWTQAQQADRRGLSAALPAGADGATLVAVGEGGARRVEIPAAAPAR